MDIRHRLVLQSALIGSILLSVFGWLVVPAKATIGNQTPLFMASLAPKTPEPTPQVNDVAGTEAILENPADCRVSAQFPERVYTWCALITRHADQHGLPPDLIAALILQESGGDPEAYSKSGAVGLMQVMPRDGLAASFRCINGPCFASRPSTAELKDPEFNVSYGVNMLAGLLERHGDVREALKAYGPMDVGFTYADIVLGLWTRYG